MQKITTFLTFDNQAEEAAKLYVSIFSESKILQTTYYQNPKGSPGATTPVMTVTFELAGQTFVALNGGPHFNFSEGVSLSVDCETQEEVDRYSEQLCAGGGALGPCGWLKDRFGLSWQINPRVLREWISDPDPAKAQRVIQAMLKMKKIDIAELRRAYSGQ